MKNGDKANKLLAMLRRNAFLSTTQRFQDEMALAGAVAEAKKWDELGEPEGIRNPQHQKGLTGL